MSMTLPDDAEPSESLTVLQQIDRLCEKFEAAWQRGEERVWDLSDVSFSAVERMQLFEELLRIDLHYRRRRNEVPCPDDYLARHPQYATVISQVLVEVAASEAVTRSDEQGGSTTTGTRDWESQLTETRYRSIRPHAEGGLGKVIIALDQGLHREVAVKRLHEQHQPDSNSYVRFIREAQLTARLEHPGIVPVYGLGTDPSGAPFYAMRFVNGETLRDAIHRLHQLSGKWRSPAWMLELRKLLARFVSLCQTIHYAHSRGVVHRDLKPANILLGEFGETLVADWGTAKVVAESNVLEGDVSGGLPSSSSLELTSAGELIGTPVFMSPEQASGGELAFDPATDIYGLGATLAMLLTDKPLVTVTDLTQMISRIQRGDLRFPREVHRGVPAALDAICRKALKRDPRQRYQTAQDLAADVELWLGGEPVEVWREPWWQRCGRWVRRHQSLSLTTGAVGLVGIVMAFLAGHWAEQEGRRERLAGLVDRIAFSDLAVLPEISKDLSSFGDDGLNALRTRLSSAHLDRQTSRNLRLVLSSHDDLNPESLIEDLQQTELPEYLIYREQLRPCLPQLATELWSAWEQHQLSPDRSLRIAGALALVDAENQRWNRYADLLVEMLCREPTLTYRIWADALKPVQTRLESGLCRLFDDASSSATSRSAAEILGLMFHDRTDLLVDLLQRAAPDQLLPIIRGLREYPEVSVPVLQHALNNLEPIPTRSLPIEDERLPYVERDRRRARAACALLALNHPDDVWHWMAPSADPTFRSLVLELVPHADIESDRLHQWWRDETHTTRRRALLMMMGRLPRSAVSLEKRATWMSELREVEQNDPDPGTHSAAQWVINAWCQDFPQLQSSARPSLGYSPDRRWYELKSGETFAIVQGPVEFLMGSPQDEYGRYLTEPLHLRRINRSFAVATREITCEQAVSRVPSLMKFCPPDQKQPGISAHRMSWYDAACYCRRLSEEEGIPEDQMCFPPVEQIGPQMMPPEDYLRRTGYRIPTQAEWEYACRAGTITAGYYGDDTELQQHYAWSVRNSSIKVNPGGLKKPNDLGLFDTLGNAHEWCFERCEGLSYSNQPGWGRTVSEDWIPRLIAPRRTYATRGGDVTLLPMGIKSAYRFRIPAGHHEALVGFRPVRTLPDDWQPFDVVPVLDVPSREARYRITGDAQPFRIEDVDPNVIVDPVGGIAPAEITVRGRTPGVHPFQFTLTQIRTGYRRMIAGQLTQMNWDIQIHPALPRSSPEPTVRDSLLAQVVPDLAAKKLTLQEPIETFHSSDDLSFIYSIDKEAKDPAAEQSPPSFAALATASPKLHPGEYFAQIYGEELPSLSVHPFLNWDFNTHRVLSNSNINVTLRISIRNASDVWRADVFSKSGRAEMWVRARPVPTLP